MGLEISKCLTLNMGWKRKYNDLNEVPTVRMCLSQVQILRLFTM